MKMKEDNEDKRELKNTGRSTEVFNASLLTMMEYPSL